MSRKNAQIKDTKEKKREKLYTKFNIKNVKDFKC